MSPDMPSDRMYDDAKAVLAILGTPIISPIKQRFHRKTLLRLFSSDFAQHPNAITQVVDYYTFHENVESWLVGNGILNTATYGETMRFWTVPDIFLPYEAKLVRFLKRGGEVRRIFLVGPEIHDPIREWVLHRTLKRHDALGFKPNVQSVVDLQREISRVGIACNMFGILNGAIGYFFRFSENDAPLMIRTTDNNTATKVDNAFFGLWKNSSTFRAWSSRWHPSVPREIEQIVKRDIECVSILAEESNA